jgi:hypothetical protein
MAYDNYLNLTNHVMAKIGITDSDVEAVAKQALNDIQQEICQSANHSWLYGNKSFITVLPYSTGTITATEGSATIIGTGVTWTSAMVGRKFNCSNATYTVATVTTTPSMELTLTTVFADTSGTGLLYKIYQDEYSLASDVDDVISIRSENSPYKLDKIGIEVMDSYWPARGAFGYPVKYSDVGYDSSGYPVIALYPIPSTARNLYYRYKKRIVEMSADADEPIIPLRYRWVLAKGALYTLAKYLDMPDIGKDFEREYIQGKAQILGADKKVDERIVKGSGVPEEELVILEWVS